MKTLQDTYGKEFFEEFTSATNRSRGQTEYLFELCDHDLNKLVELEEKLKNNFVGWVPGDKEALDKVLSMGEGNVRLLDLKKFKL